MKKNGSVIGYVRVSVDRDDKVSPEMQADAIRAYCAGHGLHLVEMIEERGRSAGEGKRRPGLDRARKILRSGQADGIVVWKIDRCSRSVKDFSNLLAELQEAGVDFISATESFDTSSPIGRAMVQITMVFAELERGRAVERSSAWHAHRVKQGAMPPGRPRYGYRRDVDDNGRYVGPLLIDDEAADVIRRAVRVFLDTHSVMAARRVLIDAGREMQVTEVRRLLMSPTIAGYRLVEGIDRSGKGQSAATKMPGNWPAIIDPSTHEELVCVLTGPKRRKPGRRSTEKWLLTGWLECGRCGRPMRGGGAGRYRCTGMKERAGEKCGTGIKREEVENYVVDRMLATITPAKWEDMRARRRDAVAPARIDVASMNTELEQMAADWGSGLLTRAEFYAAKETLLSRINSAESAVEVEESELPDVADLHRAWPDLAVEHQRLVIPLVVDKAVVQPGERGGGSLRWDPDLRVKSRVTVRFR
jgi:DNA invertase Pin-like site-specific DNA recombinase